MMKKNYFRMHYIAIFLMLLMPLSTFASVRGTEKKDVVVKSAFSFLCTPVVSDASFGDNGEIVLMSGAATEFRCVVQNNSKENEAIANISARQIDAQGLSSATSSSDMTLKPGLADQVVLKFPAVFQSGIYHYVFSLTNEETKESLAKDIVLTASVAGDIHIGIKEVFVQQDRYEWAQPFVLTVVLNKPEGKEINEGMTLMANMMNTDGEECAQLNDNYIVTKAEEVLSLTFPKEGTCTNAIKVTLRDKEGGVLDQKTIAVGLPQPLDRAMKSERFLGIPKLLLGGLVATGVLLLILGGYLMIQKKKRRTF